MLWNFRSHQIAYEQIKVGEGDTAEVKSEPVLILNGFGVGSFHQHRLKDRLVRELSVNDDTRNIYGIDYLGQGNSWPTDCNDGNSENERGLCYSIDTWFDQGKILLMVSLPSLLLTFGEVNIKFRVLGVNIIYWAFIYHRSKSCLMATSVKFKS